MRNSQYCDLFRDLATRHRRIQHTTAAPRFARIVVSLDPLQRILDLQEYLKVLATRLKAGTGDHVLVLETTNSQYQDNGGDHRKRNRHGAFLILRKGCSTPDAIAEALDSSEEIGEQVFAAVLHQFEEDVRTRFDVGNLTNDPVGPLGDGTWYGTRFDFEFQEPANAALYYNPDAFLP